MERANWLGRGNQVRKSDFNSFIQSLEEEAPKREQTQRLCEPDSGQVPSARAQRPERPAPRRALSLVRYLVSICTADNEFKVACSQQPPNKHTAQAGECLRWSINKSALDGSMFALGGRLALLESSFASMRPRLLCAAGPLRLALGRGGHYSGLECTCGRVRMRLGESD